MADFEKEEGGISLGEVFRIIFSQKWLALIILVSVTLVGTLGIYFGKRALDMHYDVSFTLELPQTETKSSSKEEGSSSKSSTVVYYPDGTPFYFTDIVSLKTLRDVQKLSEDFKDIDIEKMSKADAISISRSVTETANNSGAYEATYTLSVKANYFSSKEVAKDFLEALTETPTDYLNRMNINYYVYINKYDGEGAYKNFAKESSDYNSEITKLISQNEYIKERYDTYNKIYSDLSINGKTLLSYKVDIEKYIDTLETLRSTVNKNGYFKTEPDKDSLEIEKDKLERKLATEESILNSLSKATVDSENADYLSVIKEQAALVASLQQQLNDIEDILVMEEYKYGDAVDGEFIKALEKAYTDCIAKTEEFKSVASQLFNRVSVVSYTNSNVIVVTGVTGVVMSFAISFVSGLVLAVIIAFIVGWSKKNKPAGKVKATSKENNTVKDGE